MSYKAHSIMIIIYALFLWLKLYQKFKKWHLKSTIINNEVKNTSYFHIKINHRLIFLTGSGNATMG